MAEKAASEPARTAATRASSVAEPARGARALEGEVRTGFMSIMVAATAVSRQRPRGYAFHTPGEVDPHLGLTCGAVSDDSPLPAHAGGRAGAAGPPGRRGPGGAVPRPARRRRPPAAAAPVRGAP